jgi:hypothetical protein
MDPHRSHLVTSGTLSGMGRGGPAHFPHPRMTRYTNNGLKRTYLQASFDPNDHEILTKAASASGLDPLQAQQEVRVGVVPEPSRKRRQRSKVGSEEKIAADSSTAAVENDGNDKSMLKSEKTKKALAKLKAKEKAKRTKSTLSYL